MIEGTNKTRTGFLSYRDGREDKAHLERLDAHKVGVGTLFGFVKERRLHTMHFMNKDLSFILIDGGIPDGDIRFLLLLAPLLCVTDISDIFKGQAQVRQYKEKIQLYY